MKRCTRAPGGGSRSRSSPTAIALTTRKSRFVSSAKLGPRGASRRGTSCRCSTPGATTLRAPLHRDGVSGGDDLRELVSTLGALPSVLALRIAAQACLGLAKAHQEGVVHRDIKPANLFLARQQDGEVTVKLLDFGIAKVPTDLLASGEAGSMTITGRLLRLPAFHVPRTG